MDHLLELLAEAIQVITETLLQHLVRKPGRQPILELLYDYYKNNDKDNKHLFTNPPTLPSLCTLCHYDSPAPSHARDVSPLMEMMCCEVGVSKHLGAAPPVHWINRQTCLKRTHTKDKELSLGETDESTVTTCTVHTDRFSGDSVSSTPMKDAIVPVSTCYLKPTNE